MSAACPAGKVRRVRAVDEIVRLLGARHPHVEEGRWLKRWIERDRIAKSIRAQEGNLEYCLIAALGDDGRPLCGVLTATPKVHAEATFAACGPRPMLFGFLFGFGSYQQFEAVFEEAGRLAAETGRATLCGPFEATINYSCGLLEEEPSFPLGVLMPSNPIAWNDYFEQYGFSVAERLFTFEIELERARFQLLGGRAAGDLGLTLRQLEPPYSAEQIGAIVDVFNEGWRGNWGFVPIDESYVEDLIREFRPILWPGLSFIAYLAGRPVGILIATPDICELTRSEADGRKPSLLAGAWRFFWRRKVRAVRIFILGLTSELHGSREGASVVEMMLDAGKKAAQKYGARFVQLGWTLSTNRRVNRLVELWAPDARRVSHRIWRYRIPVAAPAVVRSQPRTVKEIALEPERAPGR